jgi:hypothetical protein
VAQRAPAGRGGPGGADAGCAFVSVSVSSASVRSPVSGAGVQHHACLSTRPLSGVRCGRLSVQVSGVRRGCPVSVGSRVHCVRPGGCGGRWGRQPHGWDGRRRRGRRPCPRPVRRLPGSDLAVEAGVGRAGPAEASALDFAVVVGVGRGSGWVDRVGDRDGLDGRGDRPLVASGMRSEAATTLRGHGVRLRAGPPGRCEPPGLGCDLRVRPWCGPRRRRASPARRWRRSDLQGWGVEVRGFEPLASSVRDLHWAFPQGTAWCCGPGKTQEKPQVNGRR